MISIIRLGSSLVAVAAVSIFSCWFGEPAQTVANDKYTVKIFQHLGGATASDAISVTVTPHEGFEWEWRLLFAEQLDSAACVFMSEDVVFLSVSLTGATNPSTPFLIDLSSPRLSGIDLGRAGGGVFDRDTLAIKIVSDDIYKVRVSPTSLGDNLLLVRTGLQQRRGLGYEVCIAGAIDVDPVIKGDTLQLGVLWREDAPMETYDFDMSGIQYNRYPKLLRPEPLELKSVGVGAL